MGMLSAIFSYAFALPGLISSFSTSIWSGVAFFLVALVSAVSVVASVLALLYGGAAGGTFALVKYAGPALARLDERIALDVTTESVTPNVGIVLWRDDRFVIFFIATSCLLYTSPSPRDS